MQLDWLQPYLSNILASPVILNLKSGNYQLEEVRAVGASALFLIFLFCAVRGRGLSFTALFWYFWFMLLGLLATFVEGYWLLFTERINAGTSLPDVAIRLFGSALDSRVLQNEIHFRTIVAICTLVSGPLSMLVAHSIQQQSKFQYPAQLIVSTVRLVTHLFVVLTNAKHEFGYTAMIPEQETTILGAFTVQLFLAFHGLVVVMSTVSILTSLLQVLSVPRAKQHQQFSMKR